MPVDPPFIRSLVPVPFVCEPVVVPLVPLFIEPVPVEYEPDVVPLPVVPVPIVEPLPVVPVPVVPVPMVDPLPVVPVPMVEPLPVVPVPVVPVVGGWVWYVPVEVPVF